MSDIAPREPETNHRVLVAVVIGLGVLFVIAILVTVVGVAMKYGKHSAAPATAAAFSLPPGATIVAMESQQNRLIVHVRSREGDEIDIVDTADGHLVARIK